MTIINIGDKERIFRVVVGLLLIGLAIANVIGVWGYIGVVPLVTALFGFCPAYSLLDINTYKTK
jgi:hypothetical protein